MCSYLVRKHTWLESDTISGAAHDHQLFAKFSEHSDCLVNLAEVSCYEERQNCLMTINSWRGEPNLQNMRLNIVHLTHFLEGGFPHNDFHTTNLGGKRFCGLRDSRLRPRNLKPKKRNTLSASLICISSEFHFLRSLSMECFLALINCSSRVLFAEYGSGLLCHGEVIQRRPLRDRHRKHRQDKESSGYCP
jgi:hypothetical protein